MAKIISLVPVSMSGLTAYTSTDPSRGKMILFFFEDIPLEGEHFIHDVPKRSTCPSIFDDTKIQIMTVRPHLTVAPSKGFVAELMEGITFKEKDGRLPGMQILGRSIKLDDESPPVHILAIQPDEDFTRYPGSANVIVGLTDREASSFWGSLASIPRTAQRTMEPDHFPSIHRTCDAVSQAVTQWRKGTQSTASKRLPVDDRDSPSSLAGSKGSGDVRNRKPYHRETEEQSS